MVAPARVPEATNVAAADDGSGAKGVVEHVALIAQTLPLQVGKDEVVQSKGPTLPCLTVLGTAITK